jgi:hypothetical protein
VLIRQVLSACVVEIPFLFPAHLKDAWNYWKEKVSFRNINQLFKGIDLDGKNVIVLGRSNIVGIPVAMLCMHKNATVTICHSKTKDLPNVVKQGDVVIAAVGKPEMVKMNYLDGIKYSR